MKFLCLDCDEPMKLHSTAGPDEGSLTVTFRCPECGFRVAMLTNPFETQMVKSLGVKVGGASGPAQPFQHITSSMAGARAVEHEDPKPLFEGDVPTPTEATGRGCPFGAMLNEQNGETEMGVSWSPEAEARVERIPSFIRPMARKAIERFAEAQGHPIITEAVMDEARGALGM
jgi:DNA-directed RNA polymerase subunit RPC12/RpoP